MKALQLTVPSSKVLVPETYSQKEMLVKAGQKLSEFGLNQESLVSVSYLPATEDKSSVLWIILKGNAVIAGKKTSLLINFYGNGNVTYMKSTGSKSSRKREPISKEQFLAIVPALTTEPVSYDTF